ncbi:esterase-like activity of phytase family protein [Cognatilysobacter terrigena]|uniref:esterase-like activity of phytase family protein n=1 Tax=Cognatilysobacter terrigena TaxID=2488749 RepID=UPI0010600D6A|nr:esterase-like activity of phytase family protein [Lysobacter terrigena]
MRPIHRLSSAIALLLAAGAASAEVRLVAIDGLSAQDGDRNAATAAPLENGVAGNLFGGIGSGLAYAGNGFFLALPDRGPNVVPYDSAVSDTTTYIPRFHTLRLDLLPARRGDAMPLRLMPRLLASTLLHSSQPLVYGDGRNVGVPDGTPALNRKNRTYYFTGRSDAFDANALSTNARDGRLDPEGIRVSPDGRSVYITDEYGPFVYRFDRVTGLRTRAYALPASFAVPHKNAVGDAEVSRNTLGRVANKGMEGLAISPDGRTLFGAMQSPLLQDGGTNAPYVRIVVIDTVSRATRQYAYPLTNIGTAAKPKYPTVSEVLAINDHEMLIDERDGKGFGDGSPAAFKRIYRVDLAGAASVDAVTGAANLAPRAVTKTLFLDVVQALTAHGIPAIDIPAKLEGIAFGPDVRVDGRMRHTLFIANDNDFLPSVTDAGHPSGAANPNMFYVFAFDGTDLPGYVAAREH